MKVTVGNIKHGHTGEYIGRAGRGRAGSPLANPFHIGRHGTREQVIARYRSWLWQNIQSGNREVMAELRRLLALARRPEGVQLLCFCAPLPCHGDVIARTLEWLDRVESEPIVAAAISLGGQIVRVG